MPEQEKAKKDIAPIAGNTIDPLLATPAVVVLGLIKPARELFGTGIVPTLVFVIGLLIASSLFVVILSRGKRRADRQVYDLNAKLARANETIHQANVKLIEGEKKQKEMASRLTKAVIEQLPRSGNAKD